ncbi:MAG: UDP-N-acetylglucosamine 2-epimerase [Betaproteobacteria bacterium]|nr:UDP-N-acetylglucosamine 2-epimerase [Betaproteobacteria bacterium]
MAPVVGALRTGETLDVKVCVTAQHRRMLDQALALFGIEPDFDLDLMRPGQELADLTAAALTGLRDVLRRWRPDWVVVHGDTTSTLAAGLAAFYERIPVAHVQAGMRTSNIHSDDDIEPRPP